MILPVKVKRPTCTTSAIVGEELGKIFRSNVELSAIHILIETADAKGIHPNDTIRLTMKQIMETVIDVGRENLCMLSYSTWNDCKKAFWRMKKRGLLEIIVHNGDIGVISLPKGKMLDQVVREYATTVY